MSQVTIDGKEYKLEDLSDNAKAQLVSIRQADQEIARLQSQLAMIQTARNTYSAALKQAIEAE